jgi:hypothetical protein
MVHDVDFDQASSDQPSGADAVSHLATGLQNNKTLKRFSFVSWIMSDRDRSRIITALKGHPTLEHLGFDILSAESKKTPESLICLLSLQTCKVWSLHLTGEVIDLGLFLERLDRNKSLKRLSLSNCYLDDDDLLNLLRIVCKIENVTHIDLSNNEISKVPVLDASIFVKKLRCLDLGDNPIIEESDEEDQSALLRLLMSAPQLGYVASPSTTQHFDLFTPLIKHYLDWNRCGRILATDHENKVLPLSMWPLVFARANEILQKDRDLLQELRVPLDSPDPRPNTIYQLFHGFFSLHPRVLSTGIESHDENNDAAEPEEKRQRLL